MMKEGPIIMMHKTMDHLTTNLMHRGITGNMFNSIQRQDRIIRTNNND